MDDGRVDTINNEENKYLYREIKPDDKDRIEVEIGDSKDGAKYFPQAKIMRWDNEVNFSLRYKDEETGREDVTIDNDRFEWVRGDKEVHIYDKAEVGEAGGLEFEVILHKKPDSNVLEFTLETKGLDFFYQPEITDEEAQPLADYESISLEEAKRKIRPENILGSYAVYHSEKNGNYSDVEYKTGKFCHVYRPKIIDNNGDWVWGELEIKNSKLTVTISQEFLDNAIYPILVDPTFGYDTLGSSSAFSNDSDVYGSKFTGAAGEVTKITAGVEGVFGPPTGYVKCLIIDESSLNIITNGTSDAVNTGTDGTPAFNDFTFSSNPAVTATDYVLGAIAEYYFIIAYDSGDTDQGYVDSSNSYSSPANLGSATNNNNKYSIYATYTVFPVATAVTETAFASTVTSMPANLPGSISSGDLLIAAVETRYATTWTVPTDWVEFDSQAGGSSVGELTLFYKIADGTEGATATWTAGTGNTGIWQVRKITNWHGTTAPESATNSGDWTTDPDPSSLSPSWGSDNTLWLEVAGNAATSSLTTGASTNYTGYELDTASSGGAQVNISSAYRENATGTEDPDEMTNAGNIRYWSAATIAIRPSGGAAPTGPTGVKTINNVAIADVKTINNVAIADISTINNSS